jgi:hypothetical protein
VLLPSIGCDVIFDDTALFHYYNNLYRGGQEALTKVIFATALLERSWLIVALTEVVALTVSLNRIKNKKRKTRG